MPLSGPTLIPIQSRTSGIILFNSSSDAQLKKKVLALGKELQDSAHDARCGLGHSNKSTTDRYSMVSDDLELRQMETEGAGLGFELRIDNPIAEPEPARIARNNSEQEEQLVAA